MRTSPNGKSSSSKKPTKSRRTGVAGSRAENPPSTNVSSPLRASKIRATPRGKAATLNHQYSDDNFVVEDNELDEAFEIPRVIRRSHQRSERGIQDEADESDDDFGQIRRAGRPQRSRKRDIGPPITIDEKVANLNPIHRGVLEGFLLEAKKESEKVGVSRSIIFSLSHTLGQIKMFKSVRAEPFSTTMLREMAINFPRGNRSRRP